MPDRTHDAPAGRRRHPFGFVVAAALVALAGASACELGSDGATEHTTPTEVATSSTLAPGASPTSRAQPATPDPAAGDPGAGDPGDPAPPSTSTVVSGGTVVSHPIGPDLVGSVRTTDLENLRYPSSVCADVIDRPPTNGYPLVDGRVEGSSERGDAYTVALRRTRSFGDVNGDGHDDVALVLECGPGSQPVPIGWIYTVDESGPRPLAQVRLDPDQLRFPDVLDTALRNIRISGSEVITDWSIYLDGDALCCPARTATVTWTWTDGRLAPGAPHYTTVLTGS